jgi:hypothetical protein
MSSELQSQTARINGAKSNGPITPEGKARSSANSRRHGLTASVLLEGESDEHFQLLLADFMDQFQPQTGVETDLVEVMAISRWRLRRLLGIETNLFELEMVHRRKEIKAEKVIDLEGRLAFVFKELSDMGNSLTLLLRYEGSLNRSYDKALKHLRELQSNRPVGSFSNPVGQVPDLSPNNPVGQVPDLPSAFPPEPPCVSMRTAEDRSGTCPTAGLQGKGSVRQAELEAHPVVRDHRLKANGLLQRPQFRWGRT